MEDRIVREKKKVFLLPGELYISKEPTIVSTILGSCVGVALFNRMLNFGGMNHYMLARPTAGDLPSGKYGDYSTEIIIKMMLAEDSNRANLEAIVLGGANVTGHLSVSTGIGENNIAIAKDILEKYKIRIVKEDIGGDSGRKVNFENWTGQVESKSIEKSAATKAIEQKKSDFAKRKIKVLVVDDSPTVRSILISAIETDPGIEVVGGASNPYEAREMLLEYDPDVICLDIIMPKMDGVTFLKKLFQYMPKPVIIISTVAQEGSALRKQAQQIGAVEVIDKEKLELYKGMDLVRSILVTKIKSAASVYLEKKSKEELENIH